MTTGRISELRMRYCGGVRYNGDEFHDTDDEGEGTETEASDCGCGGDWYNRLNSEKYSRRLWSKLAEAP